MDFRREWTFSFLLRRHGGKLCRRHLDEAKIDQVNDFIKDYIITIVTNLDSGTLIRKLGHVKLLQEAGRKM